MKDRSYKNPMSSLIGGANFLVTVHRQENMSLQGCIQWLETGETINFRSALEMITLIDNGASYHFETETKRIWNKETIRQVV